jgi:hypothetical protein
MMLLTQAQQLRPNVALKSSTSFRRSGTAAAQHMLNHHNRDKQLMDCKPTTLEEAIKSLRTEILRNAQFVQRGTELLRSTRHISQLIERRIRNVIRVDQAHDPKSQAHQ